jgi:hypothetical protein
MSPFLQLKIGQFNHKKRSKVERRKIEEMNKFGL